MRYYYMDAANQVAGPVDKEGLVELLKAKEIDKTTQICAEGAQEWGPITDVVKSKKKRGKRMTSAAMSGSSASVGGTATGMDSADTAEAGEEKEPAEEKKTKSARQPSSRPSSSSSSIGASAIPGMPQEVVVLNMNISFGRMIALMLKWAFAAIPALIILAAVTGGLFIGLLKAFPEMKTQCPFGFGHATQTAAPGKKAEKKTPPADSTVDTSGAAATDDTADTSTSGADESGTAGDTGDDFDMSDIPLPDLPTPVEEPKEPETPKKSEPTTDPETPASTLPEPTE